MQLQLQLESSEMKRMVDLKQFHRLCRLSQCQHPSNSQDAITMMPIALFGIGIENAVASSHKIFKDLKSLSV